MSNVDDIKLPPRSAAAKTPILKSEDKVVEIETSRIPCVDDHSIDFFKRLIKNDKKMLQFEDDLTIYSLSGAEIGRFVISVVPVIYKHQNCFKVKAKSNGTIDDLPCGTEINAFVNERLETIEQDHFEFIKLPQGKLERKTLINMENDDYTINLVENNQNEIKNNSFKVSKSLMNGFISESANLLLQRLMIQNDLIDTFSLFTFDKDINPCFVSYKPLDKRKIVIENEEYKVIGIERTVESVVDLPITWQLYFISDGHMVNRVQVGYPAVMKTSLRPRPIEIDEYLPRPIIEKRQLEWQTDMELTSKYLDRKDEMKNEYDEYIHNHPDLKALMADYMQSLLTFKPNDVLTFSAKFMAPYSAKTSSNRILPTLRQHVNVPRHVI